MFFSQTAILFLLFLLFQSETAARTVFPNFLKAKQHEGLMFFVPCDPFEVMFDIIFFVGFCLVCHWGLFVAQFFFSSFFFLTCYLLQSLKESSCIYISVRRNDFPCPSGKILIQVHVDCRFSIWISWVLLTGPRHSAVCHRSGEGTRMDRKQKQLALLKKKSVISTKGFSQSPRHTAKNVILSKKKTHRKQRNWNVPAQAGEPQCFWCC